MKYTAIDFETANKEYHSACSIGLVRVEDHKIIKKDYHLIRTPDSYFNHRNIQIHGLTWEDVKEELSFEELWPKIRSYFRGVDFIVAHNFTFDRSVIQTCCNYYGIDTPNKPFLCTRYMSKRVWQFDSCSLENVCDELGITFKNHHNALADALACVKIMKKAHKHIKDDLERHLYYQNNSNF
jgi:DNA polymerase-3 subunit epsilon